MDVDIAEGAIVAEYGKMPARLPLLPTTPSVCLQHRLLQHRHSPTHPPFLPP